LVRQTAIPFFFDAFEESVGVVVLASLELDHPLGVLPDKKANDIAWATVVRAE